MNNDQIAEDHTLLMVPLTTTSLLTISQVPMGGISSTIPLHSVLFIEFLHSAIQSQVVHHNKKIVIMGMLKDMLADVETQVHKRSLDYDDSIDGFAYMPSSKRDLVRFSSHPISMEDLPFVAPKVSPDRNFLLGQLYSTNEVRKEVTMMHTLKVP
ncbi:hypothetical protein GH714_017094 [Hevea brasiliensis]|uniref:Uncharacterized protein n=1 Tax=Hevea brasiliensis TaxID=3981 RepID=A0A6A6KW78_HEVBR|nr:hypothetical protein GH714_017094 [Hevea brasiliensis]